MSNNSTFISTAELNKIRENLANSFGLEEAKDVRCYHCKNWGYNCGKVMDSLGQSKCALSKTKTASFQWCKHFDYVGNKK